MNDSFERFDMTSPPVRTRWFLRPLTYLLSLPDVLAHKVQVHFEGTKELKPPFLLLSNHNAFMDFKVLTKAIFPRRANYVVAIDGFIGREWLLRNDGGPAGIAGETLQNAQRSGGHLYLSRTSRQFSVLEPASARHQTYGSGLQTTLHAAATRSTERQ